MKKYQITLTETQLVTINEALDTYSRMCCGQLEESNLWMNIEDTFKTHPDFYKGIDINEFKVDIIAAQRKHIGGRGASYNATPFIGNCYQMYKTFRHHLYKEHKRTDIGVDGDSFILPSGTEPKPKIVTINTEKI